MHRAFVWGGAVVLALIVTHPLVTGQVGPAQTSRRNVLIFVADGLRPGSVNEQDMPTLSMLRAQGVDFRNSYALFPTVTMPNAATLATGHGLGDTGVFGNSIWLGYPGFDTGNFNVAPSTPLPFLENDQVLADIDDHYKGNFVGEESFLAVARAHGYNTAAVGKLGPVAIQDVAAISPINGDVPPLPSIVIVDDLTGTASGIPLPPEVGLRLRKEGLSTEAPNRSNGYGPTSPYNNGYTGDNARAGTLMANVVQQQWFIDVTTRVLLPLFESDNRPFALVYWSRDPDGTQHNQGDSLGTLFPGINGPSSLLALHNVDRNLHQLLVWLDSHPSIKANTDIIVASDHGFATISRREVERSGRATTSEAAKHFYLDQSGRVDIDQGMLPTGFLAIDLALDLRLNLFDPDRRVLDGGRSPYKRLRLASGAWEHPAAGNGLIGDAMQKLDGSDAKAIVVANGGSDLVYVPDGNVATVRTIVGLLLTHDYVGGIFVDDKFGQIAGTLPLGPIGLVGASALPRPDIVVAFKVFYFNPNDLQTAVQMADTLLQEGQGVHGGFGRDSTYNTMIALGPDFKQAFVDRAPVTNADIVPTLAHVLGFDMKPKGSLEGRVVREALNGGPDAPISETKFLLSSVVNGVQTALYYEDLDGKRYAQTACLLSQDRQDPATAAACRSSK